MKLGQLWANKLGIAYVSLETTHHETKLSSLLPKEFAQEHQIVLLREWEGVLTAAASHPENTTLLNQVQDRVDRPIHFVFSFPGEILDAIEISYQSSDQLLSDLEQSGIFPLATPGKITAMDQIKKLAGADYIVNFSRGLILLALSERASDIHIEPSEKNIHVRFRIDGVLQERFRLEPSILNPLISRFKIMAGADIAEHRKPQDGRINLQLRDRSLDLRFSTIPTVCGEKVVLRLLGQLQHRGIPDLNELQFSASIHQRIQQVINSPNGVFFITGPTGSGKTTSLYAMLKHINSSDINILTIEDPVEYRLEGANQVQVNPLIDLDFAAALRAFLRQDPDVILVGEIRDVASAKIAAQAALTGHLVLATMHTNNSLQTVTRLMEIGVEPFLVAPSIIAVMAQRLIRRICPFCKESYPASKEFLDENFFGDGRIEVILYRGKGCERCHNTGYYGRVGIHEMFVITEEVRSLITRNTSILEIEAAAKREGFQPMRYDGLKKVLRGMTTLEEVDSIIYTETD
jgi:type IV pilus assembly protein PilB